MCGDRAGAGAQRHPKRAQWERALVQVMCQMFVASWTGVIRYHGPRPVNRPNHVWVCNHTSMIDYIILCAYSPFAVIMQLHPGWVGFLQTRVLNCLGCLWFNRTEARPFALRRPRALHVNSAVFRGGLSSRVGPALVRGA